MKLLVCVAGRYKVKVTTNPDGSVTITLEPI